MKRLLAMVMLCSVYGQQALAGCNNKCVIRNPFSGNCAFDVYVCPLSMDTVKTWLNGDTADSIKTQLKRADPIRAVQYYSDKLNLDVKIDNNVLACLTDTAVGGGFGVVCAAGVVEIGPTCFVEPTCLGSCAASSAALSDAIKECSI